MSKGISKGVSLRDACCREMEGARKGMRQGETGFGGDVPMRWICFKAETA